MVIKVWILTDSVVYYSRSRTMLRSVNFLIFFTNVPINGENKQEVHVSWQCSAIQTTRHFFFIRKEKNQVSFREYFKKFFSRPVRQVRNNFCTVLFWKIVVFMVNFYVNFLSSRKYDWNVVPRDLEKYGAPTAHASYFFFLKKWKFIYLNYYY